MITPVILAGGSGTRLWPLSRSLYPKQFINLVDAELSLFQQTVLRVAEIDITSAPLVICNNENRFMVAEQLRQIGVEPSGIILEPVGKNTAPAVALGALFVRDTAVDSNLLVLPSDHTILNQKAFEEAVGRYQHFYQADFTGRTSVAHLRHGGTEPRRKAS